MRYVSTSSTPNQVKVLDSLPRYMMKTQDGQGFIRNAQRNGLQIRCACRPTVSSPLVVHPGTSGLHLARLGNTEHEHSPLCFHGNAAGVAAALGLPSGSLGASGGQFVINFDALFEAPPQSASTGRKFTFTVPNHGSRMYALGMFLLGEAGLSSVGPRAARNLIPWKCLQAVAHSIHVTNPREAGTLENRMLLPSATYGPSRYENFAKLSRAAQKKTPNGRVVVRRVLFAALMPPGRDARTLGNFVSLWDELGVSLTIGSRPLARAWGTSVAAEKHHALGRPVLAVGMATVRDKREKGAPTQLIRSRVEQLALIPVGPLLTPTPTPQHWAALQAAMSQGSTYRVEPEEDSAFKFRCSLRRAA